MTRIALDSGLDPYALFAASRDDHPHAFNLESLTGPARLEEHTFVGFDPEIIISYRSGVLRSNGEAVKTDRPIEALRSILAKYEAPGVPGRYIGGLVGYVSYEFVRNLESVPAYADSPFPEFEFGLYLDGVIVDHIRKRTEYFAHGRSRVEDLPKANGARPEMLLRVEDNTATTFRIAVTRPLGTTLPETERFRAELLADEKERAEHHMLLDLARNDLGKVCRFGTVKVPQYMTVERYSHVQHLVSRVEGELAAGNDALEAVAAGFPAGTVSGAPKPRAMEILHDLEGTARGPYAGVVGYLSLNGNVDTAIAIRTLFADGPTYYLQAGAGIVADSDPTREWLETEHKLEGLRAALREAAA